MRLRAAAQPVADLENFGGGDEKLYEHKLWIISKFWMFMINVLDLAQTCWGYFLSVSFQKRYQYISVYTSIYLFIDTYQYMSFYIYHIFFLINQ